MKKIFISACIANIMVIRLLSAQAPTPTLLNASLTNAYYEMVQLSLTDQDRKHLAEYIEFFTSWYAPVTPASITLHNSLPQQALAFVEKLKKIAKPFERKKPRGYMGASRLTDEGKLFYQKVIAMLKELNGVN